METIQYKNVRKHIGKKEIIRGVSFDLFEGEVFGLLGPNGAGKTTIMKMTVGLSSITEGEILIMGNSIEKDFTKAIASVGSLIENPALYPYMTGYDNLKTFAKLVHASKERMNEVIDLVGLNYAMKQKVKGYSLGMKQRLGIAIALLRKPKILILDEPTNGLDPQGVTDLRNYLKRLAQAEKITVMVSSHMLPEMELLCDRFAILKAGEIQRIMTIEESRQLQGTQAMQFWVSDVAKAVACLEGQFEISAENNHFLVNATPEMVAAINRALVQNNIDVYGINSKENTLESFYFQVVNQ